MLDEVVVQPSQNEGKRNLQQQPPQTPGKRTFSCAYGGTGRSAVLLHWLELWGVKLIIGTCGNTGGFSGKSFFMSQEGFLSLIAALWW